ncbi:hypothetical protein KM043_009233 [Ampulex compressa]|nr:hypothetical protein KM043_009233 [Ampulex compressa]
MGHQGIGLAAEEARSQVRANGGRREVEERGEVGCMLESGPTNAPREETQFCEAKEGGAALTRVSPEIGGAAIPE